MKWLPKFNDYIQLRTYRTFYDYIYIQVEDSSAARRLTLKL